MRIDVGFSDNVVPPAVELSYPTLLDMPEPNLQAYTHETLIAEKVQAMVFLGMINSRMKDFYDVWTLASGRSVENISGCVHAITEACVLSAIKECFYSAFEYDWTTFHSRCAGVSPAFCTYSKSHRIVKRDARASG